MIIKRNFTLFSILLIIILSFAIYSNSFYADFQFDDGVHIAKQANLNDIERFSNISSWTNINERPLSFFSLSLNHYFGGTNVFGYHLFNLIVHILSGIMVFLLSHLLIKKAEIKSTLIELDERILALFVALIFVSHPIQTQSVTYIVQRMTSMLALFYLGSIYFYLLGRFEYAKRTSVFKIYLFYFLSILFATAALLCKQTAATIPLAILLVEFFFVRDLNGKIFKNYLLVFAGVLLAAAVAISVAGLIPKETDSISRADYLVTQFRVFVKYFQLFIFPVSQNLDYDFPISTTFWGVKEIASLLLNLGVIYLAVRLFKKHKIISFGILWIYVSLLVESSIIPIKDVIFEHRLYLSMFGFALVLVVLLVENVNIKKNNSFIILLLLIVFVYSLATFNRNRVWKTELSLWTDVLKKSPNKVRAHLNLGEAYFHISQYQRALYHFNRAIEVDDHPNWLGYFNRAEVAAYLNKPKAAIMDLTQSIRYKKDFAESYDSRGVAKIHIQDYQSAIIDFDSAIALKPSLESAWFNRANAKIYIGDFESAMTDFNQAIKIKPDFAEAYNNRGQLKLNNADFVEAINDLTKAIAIRPNFEGAYNNRAKAKMGLNHLREAILDFDTSISISNNNSLVFRYRGMCYYGLSDLDHAFIDFVKAATLGDTLAPKLVNSLQEKIQSPKHHNKN